MYYMTLILISLSFLNNIRLDLPIARANIVLRSSTGSQRRCDTC